MVSANMCEAEYIATQCLASNALHLPYYLVEHKNSVSVARREMKRIAIQRVPLPPWGRSAAAAVKCPSSTEASDSCAMTLPSSCGSASRED